MSRVITFSRTFPSYHPRKGELTSFVEKIWKSIYDQTGTVQLIGQYEGAYTDAFGVQYKPEENIHFYKPKNHTIRAGRRWKVGDKFSPRVWSGKPYNSKRITIAPDIEIKKIWDVEIDELGVWAIGLPGEQIKYTDEAQDEAIARNDGLSEQDLYWWFKGSKKPFVGQIICWNEAIEY